jgi:hypothetical protein
VSSSDNGTPGRTALMYRTFVVPSGAGVLRCLAYASYGKDLSPIGDLDIVLMAAGKKIIPKQVRTATGWKQVQAIDGRQDGKPREYVWLINNYVGQTLRLALVDEDKRPNCHLFATGFQLVPNDVFEGREFGQFMVKLVREQKLHPVARFESEHFMAYSNAEDAFTELRLNNCELIYDIFYDHFRKKGFRLRQPGSKMMVAIFENQAGFEAYLGQKMSPLVTGVYHPPSNRLVVYDYGQNEMFVAIKKEVMDISRRIPSDLGRQRFVSTINRMAKEFRTEANIGTVMHEVSHQLSFNSGLLNREGDVALWLAEGLATYCESTHNCSWQGIGEPNPERLQVLAGPWPRIPLKDLISGNSWLHGSQATVQTALMGYAQSWALFRMLMEERTVAFRNYLNTVYTRKTADHRLADFVEAFGDLTRLELRFGEYVKKITDDYTRTLPKR